VTGILAALAGGRTKPPFEQTPAPVAETASATTTLTLTKPTGTIYDDLLISVAMSPGPGHTWTPGTGFSERLDSQNLELATRLTDGAEAATFTPTASGSGNLSGTIIRLTSAAYDTVGTVSSNGTSPAAPQITMAAAGKLFAVFFNPSAGITFSTPAGMTPLVSNTTGCSFAVFVEDVASGATGTRTSNATGTGNNASRGVLISAIPA
jgi:hypothetical protein